MPMLDTLKQSLKSFLRPEPAICPECSAPYPSNAAACFECGVPREGNGTFRILRRILLLIGLGFLVLALVTYLLETLLGPFIGVYPGMISTNFLVIGGVCVLLFLIPAILALFWAS
mgnify:CR=1 FL=1